MYNMDINLFGFSFRLEILILIVIVLLFLIGNTCTSCCHSWHTMENFTPANTNYGKSSDYSSTDQINTSSWGSSNLVVTPGAPSWGQPSLVFTKGQPIPAGVQNILNRTPQPIPLPEGELDMFATTPFKPECCPNTYSNGSGCACMTAQQYNYLINRGSNNVPYSEY